MAGEYEAALRRLEFKLLDLKASDRALERLREEFSQQWERHCYKLRDFDSMEQQAQRMKLQIGADDSVPQRSAESAGNRQISREFLLATAESIGANVKP